MIRKSPWVTFYDIGGCNGCTLEWNAAISPVYDLERFGIKLVDSPKHADIVIIAGTITTQSLESLRRILKNTPKPRKIIALGSCAISGGLFKQSYNSKGPLDHLVNVDMYIPGCPPKPEAIIHGLLKALGRKE